MSTNHEVVQQIHNAGTRMVLAVTGGGSGAISALLTVPGASRSVLLAAVPYADTALIEWLGARPEQFCSARTARAMAMVAFEKAIRLSGGAGPVIGVGCTASLASDRPKRGPHRFYVAVQTASPTTSLFVELEKDRRSRAEEEQLVADTILNEIADAVGVAARINIALQPSETPDRTRAEAPKAWQSLLAGRVQKIAGQGSGNDTAAIFPGAFNPLHIGHKKMAAVAAKLLGVPIAFEISVANVDKPPLDFLEIEERLGQFAGTPVWLTRAPTFALKSTLFPGATFIVGADTLERIAEPRYYHDNIPAMLRAIEQIAVAGCRFLVFGRNFEGRFQSVEDLNLPPSLTALCTPVPESEFREDVSSTALRHTDDAPE